MSKLTLYAPRAWLSDTELLAETERIVALGYHPLSCRRCFADRAACGMHGAGDSGHEDCTELAGALGVAKSAPRPTVTLELEELAELLELAGRTDVDVADMVARRHGLVWDGPAGAYVACSPLRRGGEVS